MQTIIQTLGFSGVAILSAFFAALATILARTLLKDLKSKEILGISFLTMGATLVLLSPMFYHFEANIITISLLVMIALIDTAANYFYFKTFEKTEASVAAPVLSLAPAFTFFFGWLFLDDVVNILTFALALGIIVLVVVFSADFSNLKKSKTATLIPALVSSFLFGLSAIPAKYLLSSLEATNAPTLYMFRAGLIALFALLVFGFKVREITTKQYKIIFFRGLIVIAQWVLLYYALTIGNAGVTLTLGNITPIFVFILGAIFLREKITSKKILAALSVLILSLII